MDNSAFTEYFTSNNIRIAGDAMNPLFLAVDVAKRIGDTNHNAIISKYKPSYVEKLPHRDYPNHTAGVNFLTEPGLYRYLLRSERKEAEPFQEWVYDQLKLLRLKLIDSVALAAKIAQDKLKIAQEDLRAANDIIDAVSISTYDSARVDSCPRGLSEHYMGRFLIQYRVMRPELTRELIDNDLSEQLYIIACHMYNDEQTEYYKLVELILCNHFKI